MNLFKLSRIFLYAIPIIPFIVWAELLFPYVVPKVILFRVIVEIAFLLLLVAMAQSRGRIEGLKSSYFFWIFGALILVEFVSALFGESFLYSFFGDMERMWGIFTLLHFFLFFVLLRALFQERQWRIFFHMSFAASVLVGLYGIIQRYPDFFGIRLFEAGASRIPSTLGNPTYVAIYLLFNIAFALYILSRAVVARKNSEVDGCGKLRTKVFYIAVIFIDFYAFSLTDIRGAYLGLILGIGFAGLLYLVFGSSRRARLSFALLMIVGAAVLFLAFSYPRNPIVLKTPILRRMATISLSDTTVKTRFISWNAAYQGFKERPLLGVGAENFNIVFDKFYQARYYQYARTETYFDRAHNQYLNILSEAGIFGFLSFFGMAMAIGFYLVRGFYKQKIALCEFMIFGGMSIAYFTHLFFAFDEVSTLLMFVAFAGLLEFLFHKRALLAHGTAAAHKPNIAATVLLVLYVPAVLYAMFSINIKTAQVAKISARAVAAADYPEQSIAHYQAALGAGLIPSENIVIAFVDYLARLSDHEEKIKSNPDKLKIILAGYADAQFALEREIKKKPHDALLRMKLGYLNNAWFVFDNDIEHLAKAIRELQNAADLSPERLQIYYILGESLVLSDQLKEAISVLEKAVALDPEFGASYYFLGRAYAADGQLEKGYEYMITMALDDSKYPHVPQDSRLLLYLSQTMAERGDYEKVAVIYERLIRFNFSGADIWAGLAVAYVHSGEYEKAIQAAQKASEIDPSFSEEAEFIIEMIQTGRVDELKKSVR